MKKRILVTGGAGFIGSHTIIELFKAGYDPIIIDNFSNSHKSVIGNIEDILQTRLEIAEADGTNQDSLSKVFQKFDPIEGVIHFAANKSVTESIINPLKYYKNNLTFLFNLLGCMNKFNVTNFVFSSTCAVYGDPQSLPISEKESLNPKSPYGETKRMCEKVIIDTCHASATKAVILRYFNPIGAHPSSKIGELPLDAPQNLVPIVTQTAAGVRESFVVYGVDYHTKDGSCVRDFIHIVDLAQAHVKALQFIERNDFSYEIFNIGTGKGYSVLEIINTFEKISGIKLNYSIAPRREGEIEKIYSDVTKSKFILGWEAKLSLEEALVDAWNWEKKLRNLN
ncbi:MAG TPA: UDP-glucose 4-epimerase GalE [Cytophagaceae bacterium]|jgi:UDP-glucose 4-epimerase|nr:UDP-glucose 4-epimerase GalE [Cytophagaceae bacterium]